MNSFSQTVTDKICFSHDKAKSIAIDLTRGDSAIAELKITNKLVYQLNEKIDVKDSIINIYSSKEVNYLKQVTEYEKIVTVQDTIIKGLEQDINTLTIKNTNLKKGVKWLGGGFLSTTLILIIFTIIK